MYTRLSLSPPPLWRVHRAGLRLGGVLALCYRPRHHRSHGHVTRGEVGHACCCDEAARAGDHIDTSAAAEVRVLTAVTGCGDSVPLGESSDADWWPGVYCTQHCTPLYSTVHCTRPPVPAHLVPPSCRQWCRPRISPGPGLGHTGGPHTGHTHHCADLDTSSFSDLTIRLFKSVPLLAHFVLVCF